MSRPIVTSVLLMLGLAFVEARSASDDQVLTTVTNTTNTTNTTGSEVVDETAGFQITLGNAEIGDVTPAVLQKLAKSLTEEGLDLKGGLQASPGSVIITGVAYLTSALDAEATSGDIAKKIQEVVQKIVAEDKSLANVLGTSVSVVAVKDSTSEVTCEIFVGANETVKLPYGGDNCTIVSCMTGYVLAVGENSCEMSDADDDLSDGAIAGAVVGSVVGAAVIVGVVAVVSGAVGGGAGGAAGGGATATAAAGHEPIAV